MRNEGRFGNSFKFFKDWKLKTRIEYSEITHIFDVTTQIYRSSLQSDRKTLQDGYIITLDIIGFRE